MENALVQVLEHQVKDAKDYPQIQARIQQHLEQTRRHADLVEGCVKRLGGSTSTLKTGFATLFGQFQALSTGPAEDEMMKNALTDFAAENFEIASYKALIIAAQTVGDQETATVCQQILQDEQEMARWLDENLPMVTQDALRKVASPA
jgi:ferritin-like metal-binding protein YciE